MKLLNVSAGKVQTVQIGSEVVRTAHLKEPCPEPWQIGENGVAGDQRATHPDKLYAFARSAYEYWGTALSIDPARWPDGFFGENLTLDELDETELRVGDVFAIGDEARIFVAGARNPCVKLSWRLSQPPTFQQRFAKSARAGAYFGVDRPGRVSPGDRLDRIAHDPAMPTVAEVSGFIIDPELPPAETLRRLLGYARLSATNRLLLTPKLEAAERAADAIGGRWRGWRDFHVDRIVAEAPDIRSVHLVSVDRGRLPRAKPGQFVTVELIDAGGARVVRSWSLSSHVHEPDSYRLTVRRQEGPGSNAFHALAPGDTVRLRAPAGEFALDAGSFRPVVLVAAGIGITPLKAMLDGQLARRDPPPIHLIYGGRDAESLAFRAELETLAASHPDFSLTLAYSRAGEAGPPSGRITPELITNALDLAVTIDGRRHRVPWFEANIYLCGPGDFCGRLCEGLAARGGNADRIYSERFVAPAFEDTELAEARIVFARSKTSAIWRSADGLSLLELAEAAGTKIESSCRTGSCLTCRTPLLAGDATARFEDGTILPCVAQPKTAELTLAI